MSSCRLDRPEQRPGQILADAAGIEPGFQPLLGFLVQRHQPLFPALAVDFQYLMHTAALVAADLESDQLANAASGIGQYCKKSPVSHAYWQDGFLFAAIRHFLGDPLNRRIKQPPAILRRKPYGL